MNLFIDKENFMSFIKLVGKNPFDNCLRLMKDKFHVVFNFDKQEAKVDHTLGMYLTIFNQGREDNEESDSYRSDKYPERPFNIETIKRFKKSDFSSVYLLNDFDEKLKGYVLCGCQGEEHSVLEQLFCGEEMENSCMYNLLDDFSWKDLEKDTLPCSDIVMCDNYLFDISKEEGKLTETNIEPMLSALTKNTKNKINIVIYTAYDSLSKFGVENALKKIKEAVKKSTGSEPNVTFVTDSAIKELPHDRTIIMNYRFLSSGIGTNLFDSHGEKNHRGYIFSMNSLIVKNYADVSNSIIKDLNDKYLNLKKLESEDKFVKGDKVSNFIDFNVSLPIEIANSTSYSKNNNKAREVIRNSSEDVPEDTREEVNTMTNGLKVIGKIDLSQINDIRSKKKSQNQINGGGYEGKIVLKNNYKNIECDEFPYLLRIQDNSKDDVEEDEFVTFTANFVAPYWFATNVRLKED